MSQPPNERIDDAIPNTEGETIFTQTCDELSEWIEKGPGKTARICLVMSDGTEKGQNYYYSNCDPLNSGKMLAAALRVIKKSIDFDLMT